MHNMDSIVSAYSMKFLRLYNTMGFFMLDAARLGIFPSVDGTD